MTPDQISSLRLQNQIISNTGFNIPSEIVGWMGAMQAQDFTMAKWAVGLRLKNTTDQSVEAAFNRGEILRTHLLRPTWHFVCPEDIYWMIDLTAPGIKSIMGPMDRKLELTEALFSKTNRLLEKLLSVNTEASRDEIASSMKDARIPTSENRMSHILMRAELEGLICSGPLKGRKQTYTLLSKRVPIAKRLNKDEALAMLASRYFMSHGPATLHDFAWWSGLSVTKARQALDAVKTQFSSETVLSETYWFKDVEIEKLAYRQGTYLLPAFDEYLISYRNRSASISAEHHRKAISINGIFYPLIVINGQVEGLWQKKTAKNKVNIRLAFFKPQKKEILKAIEKEVEIYARFLQKEANTLFP